MNSRERYMLRGFASLRGLRRRLCGLTLRIGADPTNLDLGRLLLVRNTVVLVGTSLSSRIVRFFLFFLFFKISLRSSHHRALPSRAGDFTNCLSSRSFLLMSGKAPNQLFDLIVPNFSAKPDSYLQTFLSAPSCEIDSQGCSSLLLCCHSWNYSYT